MKFEYRNFLEDIMKERDEQPKVLLKTYVSLRKFQGVDELAKYKGLPRSAMIRIIIDFFFKAFEKEFDEAHEWCKPSKRGIGK